MRRLITALVLAAGLLTALGAGRGPAAHAAVTAPLAPAAAAQPAVPVAAAVSLSAVKALDARPPHTLTYDAWHWALAQRGKPYEWGQTGPGGFDCSGLVWAAYHAAGITLPRDTYQMLASDMLVPTSDPTPGTLAFYGSGHVELWTGPGMTYGAQQAGTLIGFHTFSGWWHPTEFFRVRGAG
jgi:peptidoglycan DL-endopeptidase CwlO